MKTGSERSAETSFGLALRLMVLAVVMLVVGSVSVWVATQFGIVSLNLAVLALVVCIVAALIAHVLGEHPRGDEYFMARLAASMSVRTGLPLFVVVFVKLSDRIPFESGFVFCVVLFYLVGLVMDVSLHVLRVRPKG